MIKSLSIAGATLCLAFATPAAAGVGSYGHQGRWITDSSGRVVVLHGVNMVNKIQAGAYAPSGIGFGDDDARFLAGNGFNVVRLGVIWKALEPHPGVYDDAYLGRIYETYETLRRRGIAVLVDFHQDMYNERFQGEGAPDWAVLGPAATENPSPQAGFPANYIFQDSVNHAYDAFWNNTSVPGTGRGVQNLYAAAWAHVAKRFAGKPGIVGYNLFNEPWPGSQGKNATVQGCATSPRSCGVRQFEAGALTSFHKRVAAAIRRVDKRTLLWPAPLLVFDFGFESGLGKIDNRAGFAFNAYCAQAVGLDAVIPFLRGKPCSYSAALSFENAEAVSRRTGSALLMTELGATDKLSDFQPYLTGADAHMVSWTYWAYCGCSDPTTSGPGDTQAIVVDPSKPPTGSNVKTDKLRFLARPYPAATSGTPSGWTFAPSTRTFRLTYTPRRAGGGRAFTAGSLTEVSVPAGHYARRYQVRVSGARVTSKAGASTLQLALCPGARKVTLQIRPGTTPAAARRCR